MSRRRAGKRSASPDATGKRTPPPEAARIARRFARRYREASGNDFFLIGPELERAVGELLRRAPRPDRLVEEVLETALEEGLRRGLPTLDLGAIARSFERRREAWEVIVRRGLEVDRKLAHLWFRGAGPRPAPDVTNAVVLARFKVEMKGAGDLRPRSIASYLTSSEHFARLLGESARGLLDAAPDDVRAFKARLVSRRMAPASINLRLAGAKALYRLLVREGLAGHEILEAFRGVPVPKRIRTLLTAEEVERLLAAIGRRTPLGLRDQAFFRLLFATGARVGELTHLGLVDLDLANSRVVFVGRKNREDHIALLPRPVVRALEAYLAKGRPALLSVKGAKAAKARPENERLVFLSRRGGVFHRASVSERLAIYARTAKITKRVTSHTFRRSIATALAERGMPAEVIRVFLGHRKLSTTLGAYVAYSRENLRANLEKYHPWFGAGGGATKPRRTKAARRAQRKRRTQRKRRLGPGKRKPGRKKTR